MIVSTIKISEILKDKRFEGKFYLNPNARNSRVVKELGLELKELSLFGQLFNPSIFKRQYCSKTETSVQYKQSHDIIKLNYESNTYLPEKQVSKLNLKVCEGWILITGFGTVVGYAGQVDKYFNGSAFANNVARLIVNNENYAGYLTAFLKSKYGRSQINKNASGSAIRYIEAPGIGKTLVPIISKDILNKVDSNIKKVKQLRDEAYNNIYNAKQVFKEFIKSLKSQNVKKRHDSISLQQIKESCQLRLNSNSFVNEGVYTVDELFKSGIKFKKLRELNYQVRRPGIFKRVKVKKEYGIPYLKGADLSLLNPFAECEYLSKTKTPFIEEMLLKDKQVLLTCAGNVGFSRIITKEFEEEKALGSQDIIRIETTDKDFNGYYLFAYLSLDFVISYINSLRYGSVIHRIEPFHVEELPVLILPERQRKEVSILVEGYCNSLYEAFKIEKEAIDLIEKEIESWQN